MPRSDRVTGEPPPEASPPQEGQPPAKATSPRRKTPRAKAQEAKAAPEGTTPKAPSATGKASPRRAPAGAKGSKAPARAAPAAEVAPAKTPARKKASKEAPPAAEPPVEAPAVAARVPHLLARYRDELRPTLMREFGYHNLLEVPRLRKVVMNMGLGEAIQNPRALETATQDMATITGQRPVVTRARKSVSAFKVREGMAVGASVTLRSHRMYHFFQRLVNAVLPRIRDFRGVSRSSFDGQGNYSLGIREHVVFPEIDYNKVDRIRGLQVTFVTSAQTDREALRLLELMGMPFAREGERR